MPTAISRMIVFSNLRHSLVISWPSDSWDTVSRFSAVGFSSWPAVDWGRFSCWPAEGCWSWPTEARERLSFWPVEESCEFSRWPVENCCEFSRWPAKAGGGVLSADPLLPPLLKMSKLVASVFLLLTKDSFFKLKKCDKLEMCISIMFYCSHQLRQ